MAGKAKMKVASSNQRVRASFVPDTLNEEARTVRVVFTTGESGKRYNWETGEWFMEELEISREAINTVRLDKGLSVLDNHNRYSVDGVFGITENDYTIENGELAGIVRFASDEDSDRKFQKVKEKILKHCSLGYSIEEYRVKTGDGDKLPTYIASRWTPNELSFTPVSFETTNGVRNNDDSQQFSEIQIKEELNMRTLEQLRAALLAAQTRSAPDTELADLQRQIDEAILAATPPTPDAVVAPAVEPVRSAPVVAPVVAAPVAAPVVDTVAVRAAAVAELQPMLDAVRSAGLNDNFAITNFNAGRTLDEHRALVITELSNESSVNFVRSNGLPLNQDQRSDANEIRVEAAANSILQRCGRVIETPTDAMRQFSGLSMFDMGRTFAEAAGENMMGMSVMKRAERAFHSTSDFPLILENVMHKFLKAGYTETPQTWRDLGTPTTVNDFRFKHTYQMGDAPDLLPIGQYGEYQSGTMGEGKEKYKIGTYARKIGYTRQMLINDDMSALSTAPQMWGQAGSRLESDIVWGLLLGYNFRLNTAEVTTMEDGLPLYDAGHANLLGAGSAFSEAALSEMRKLGRKFKTLDGNFMNVSFNDLVFPEDLETAAEKILVQTITAVVTGDTNPFQNKLRMRVEPRLGVVSQTAWYAFSAMFKAFEYAYLAGEEQMYTEVNTHTDIDGLEIKVRHDFGAGLSESRATVKATGAA